MATISVAQLTNNSIWFLNAAAWNNYWANASVSVTSADIPAAGASSLGGVYKATAPDTTYTTPLYGTTYYCILNVDTDGSGTLSTVNLVTKEAFDQAITNIAQLHATLADLYAKLQASGAIS